MVKQITTLEELNDELNNNSTYSILYFTATWCGPCRVISPFVEELDKNSDITNVLFLKVDVDESEELCEKFNIEKMPTFIFLNKEQQVCDSMSGANKDLLSEKIKNLFIENNNNQEKPHLEKQNVVINDNDTNF